jgi:hypothetical protein
MNDLYVAENFREEYNLPVLEYNSSLFLNEDVKGHLGICKSVYFPFIYKGYTVLMPLEYYSFIKNWNVRKHTG